MSFYSDASLVLVPSGVKDSKVYSIKPTDGSGDLTFTRNSNATRIGPDGKLEKVRQNLVLQSSNFGTTWVLNGTSRTDTGTTLNGEAVWEIFGSGGIYQSVGSTIGTVYSSSIYVKPSTGTQVQLRYGGTLSKNAFFDFSTKSFYGVTVAETYAEELADGWWRLTIQEPANANSIDFAIYSSPSASVYISSAQVEVSDFGPTDYIPTTSAAVSVGPTANVPRLDYSGGATCPSLLLEPQRTNFVTYSEQLDHASWGKGGATVLANQVVSPDGYTNADKVSIPSGGSYYVYKILSGFSAGNVTLSCWAKADTPQVVGFSDGNANPNSISLTTEWQRFTLTFNYTGGGIGIQFDNYFGVSPSGQAKEFYVWGCQAEQGSYASSYIPTGGSGASVTRLADAAYKTGISSLIGQTEGTMFLDFVYNDKGNQSVDAPFISLRTPTNSGFIIVYRYSSTFAIRVFNGGSNQFFTTYSVDNDTRLKLALAYKENDFALYINGSQVLTDNAGTVPATSVLDFNNYYNGVNENISKINQILLTKTRLPNSDLATLTSL